MVSIVPVDVFRMVTHNGNTKVLGGFTENECTPENLFNQTTTAQPKQNCGISCFNYNGRHKFPLPNGLDWSALFAEIKANKQQYYHCPPDYPVGKNSRMFYHPSFPDTLIDAKHKGYKGTVCFYDCYQLAENTTLPANVKIRQDNANSGHHTIYPTQAFDNAERVVVDFIPYWVHPDIAGLDWKLHCFYMQAAAAPKEYEIHFDTDTWNAARILFQHIETFEFDDLERANNILLALADQNYPFLGNVTNSDLWEPLPRLLSAIMEYCDINDRNMISHITELVLLK